MTLCRQIPRVLILFTAAITFTTGCRSSSIGDQRTMHHHQ